MPRSPSSRPRILPLLPVVLLLLAAGPAAAEDAEPPVAPELLQAMKWRLIGPFRGGRVTAVAGVRGEPMSFYFGATGGGVWKTDDGGTTWRNVSDGHFATGTVGAVAVAESDPNVIYVGTGEAEIRGVTTSYGDGVYQSTDAGRSWSHLGLERSRQISAIRVHPKNPNVVYVAAQGNPWTPNPERGVYRSRDGGLTWRHVFFVNDRTGVSDLAMDPTNPRILYAAFWEHQRLPWKISSGGEGSGLYKSTDGGDSWTRLTDGLPELMGKIGVAVSAARPDRVWALVEADDGGLFRSDDGGKTWKRVNGERQLRARAWYYTKVVADPRDADTVWVINAPLLRSVDGGRTFSRVRTPHGDNHALWIDPDDPRRMINGNDGGANVSFNGGATWSTQANQPTGQFYRVATDERFPYFVYGGQQDNSTVAIASRASGPGIGREDWYPVGGCESAHIAFDPQDPWLVYAGCYQGLITEYDVETRHERNVMAYPYLGLGADARDLEYRFNWNAPIAVSPHDPSVIYHAGNVVLRSRDRGQTWEVLSGDLTRDEESKQGKGGGPFTNEAAGAETYGTIFAFVESPHEPGVFWAGSDDGLVHLSRDDGTTWTDVTPEGVGEAQINAIEVSPHDPAAAWLAVTRYKLGDFAPLIFKTGDYGASWTRLVSGIAEEAFVRVVREDPERAGLVYAGTERGLYVSFDGGEHWQPFQSNLPMVPITDLAVHGSDLVAATQGRAFWILDDLSPLRHIDAEVEAAEVYLFQPRPAYRVTWASEDETPPGRGENPPDGAILYYYLSDAVVEKIERANDEMEEDAAGDDEEKVAADDEAAGEEQVSDEGGDEAEAEEGTEDTVVTLEIVDAEGQVIRSFSSREEPRDEEATPLAKLGFKEPKPLPVEAGLNRFIWDLRREQVRHVPGLYVLSPGSKTYRVAPGTYTVRLSVVSRFPSGASVKVGDPLTERALEVLPDPRNHAVAADFAEQQKLIALIWDRVDRIHGAVARLRQVRRQVEELMDRVEDREGAVEIREAGEALAAKITAWEERLVQPEMETFQDVINFPNRLNAQLLFLLDVADESDPPVTAGERQRFFDLDAEWREREAEMRAIIDVDLAAFNQLFETYRVPAVIVPGDS